MITVLDNTKQRSKAGLAGAAAAGLALGLTELIAGLFDRVPSALSAVGGIVVDRTPGFVERFAIQVFGTADKGALAIGTVVVGVIAGYVIGKLAWSRPRAADVGFGLFALVGLVATLGEPLITPVGAVVSVLVSAAAAWLLLRGILGLLHAPEVETPTDGLPADAGRRRFATTIAGAGAVGLFGGFAGRKLIIDRSERVREATGLPVPESPVAPPAAGQFFEVDGLEEIVVPAREFYRIDTALIGSPPRSCRDVAPQDHGHGRPRAGVLARRSAGDGSSRAIRDDLLCVQQGGRRSRWQREMDRASVWSSFSIEPESRRTPPRSSVRSVDGWTAGFPTDGGIRWP